MRAIPYIFGRPYVVQTTWADLVANYPPTDYAVG